MKQMMFAEMGVGIVRVYVLINVDVQIKLRSSTFTSRDKIRRVVEMDRHLCCLKIDYTTHTFDRPYLSSFPSFEVANMLGTVHLRLLLIIVLAAGWMFTTSDGSLLGKFPLLDRSGVHCRIV